MTDNQQMWEGANLIALKALNCRDGIVQHLSVKKIKQKSNLFKKKKLSLKNEHMPRARQALM